MPRIVKDKATPKTGGVTNRAHPTHASCFEPGISNFRLACPELVEGVSDFPKFIPIHRGSVGPNYAKRTQFIAPRPKYAKRTQSPLLASPKNAKRTQFHAPTSLATPHFTKRTQFAPTPARPTTQKMRNEPNFRCSEQILTTNDWRLKTAFNETNPILTNGN